MKSRKNRITMMNCYDLTTHRHISDANYTHYVNGFIHPDRIMQEHDFVYITDGEWEIYQNGTAFFVKGGDAIILHAGQHHYGRQKCTPGTHTIYFHISASDKDFFSCKDSFSDANTSTLITLPDTVIHTHSNPHVRTLFEEIFAVWRQTGNRKDQKLHCLFNLLLLTLSECMSPVSPGDIALISKVCTILAQNPQRFYRTDELAALSGISVKTLNHRFQTVYQKTVYQYQMGEKIRQVQSFLLDFPDEKLSAVAMNFGFYDEYHLNKVFKKYTGQTPGFYRKEHLPLTARHSALQYHRKPFE